MGFMRAVATAIIFDTAIVAWGVAAFEWFH
jgi:hypothetical protein